MPSPAASKQGHRRLLLCTLASLLLHLLAALGVQWLAPEAPAYLRTRFRTLPATAPERLRVDSAPEAVASEMRRVTTGFAAAAPPEPDVDPAALAPVTVAAGPLGVGEESRADSLSSRGPTDEQDVRPFLFDSPPPGRTHDMVLDLLDLRTLAASERYRAAVVVDPRGEEPPEGFIHFRHLLVRGSTRTFRLEDLARYMRDHTPFLAYATGAAVNGLYSERLLQDPIQFLFPSDSPTAFGSSERILLNDVESGLLGRYLKGGGLLFVDADTSSDGRRFLREAIRQIRRALQDDGQVVELAVDHPLYTAWYDFPAGFPGEDKSRWQTVTTGTNPWYYPAQPPLAPPIGLYGVRSGDRLVAVISDLDLHTRWVDRPLPEPGDQSGTTQTDEEEAAPPREPTILFLRAATNVVVYAMTRPGSPALRLAPFAWRQRPAAAP